MNPSFSGRVMSHANKRDHHHPLVGHCWVQKGWGMWRVSMDRRQRVIEWWPGRGRQFLLSPWPSPVPLVLIYLLPEENFRHQQLADQQSLDSTFLFSTFSSCLYTVVSLMTRCYGLNVSPQNSYVEILTLNVVVLGGGAFVHEGRALRNAISPLIKKTPTKLSCPIHYVRTQQEDGHLQTKEEAFIKNVTMPAPWSWTCSLQNCEK